MQPLVSVSLSGFDALTQKVGNVTDLLEHLDPKHPVFTDALARIKEHVVQQVKERTPVRTGRLRDDIRGWVQPGEAIVETTVPYARHIEWGTRPSDRYMSIFGRFIKRPSTSRPAKNGWFVNENYMPFKKVRISGIKPYRMFKSGVEASTQFISEALHQAVTLLFL